MNPDGPWHNQAKTKSWKDVSIVCLDDQKEMTKVSSMHQVNQRKQIVFMFIPAQEREVLPRTQQEQMGYHSQKWHDPANEGSNLLTTKFKQSTDKHINQKKCLPNDERTYKGHFMFTLLQM